MTAGVLDASADVAYEVLCRKHHRQRLTAAAAKAAELTRAGSLTSVAGGGAGGIGSV